MQERSPSPAPSTGSSLSGVKQKTKRKAQAFGGVASRDENAREDWRWAVAQIEQQIDGAGPSDISQLALASQQARESLAVALAAQAACRGSEPTAGSNFGERGDAQQWHSGGSVGQPKLDERLLSVATPPRAPSVTK